MSASLSPWSVRAVNLAEHADNPVHTVEGGIAAGYGGAVVAGTTIYAYLTRPVASAWGVRWVSTGSADVRFLAAVLADDPIDLVPVVADGQWSIEARRDSGLRAICVVSLDQPTLDDPVGDRLEPLVEELGDRWVGYAGRVAEDLAIYSEHDLVHPAVWPALANRVFAAQLVDGAWVHTRSRIRHLGPASPGEVAVVEAWVTDRFASRAGERVVADVRVSVAGRPVAAIQHEAIVTLRAGDAE